MDVAQFKDGRIRSLYVSVAGSMPGSTVSVR
jgi:hypothetical protein